MKAIQLFLFTLIQLSLTGTISSQTIISLTFTATTDGLHQPLDSVTVENLTQGGDTVLYYPDTVLVLHAGIGIIDPLSRGNGGLILHPSFPNPFTGQTTTRFFLPQEDQVWLRVFDLKGREVGAYQQRLAAGEHTFTIYTGTEKNYLLVVETSKYQVVQKLINLGGGGALRIEHSCHHHGPSGYRKGKSGFPWVPGDQMQLIGYVALNGVFSVSDTMLVNPVISNYYTFAFSVYPKGYVHCDPVSPTTIVDVTNPTTGKTWMDRNLGALQSAVASTDTLAYGDLYQWGRFADGHQCRASGVTTTLSLFDQPGHSDFIIAPNEPRDWRNPPNAILWQGMYGMNNPCPAGYRVPTDAEWNVERLSWNSNNSAGADASTLKLPCAGARDGLTGSVILVGTYGGYYCSSVLGIYSRSLGFTSSEAGTGSSLRAYGYSVRCIKD